MSEVFLNLTRLDNRDELGGGDVSQGSGTREGAETFVVSVMMMMMMMMMSRVMSVRTVRVRGVRMPMSGK